MKTVKAILRVGMLLSLIALPFQAFAHTGLKSSVPANGATVEVAPASLDLEFTAAVRLIKLEVTSAGKAVATSFKPSAESKAAFSITDLNLGAGTYSVNWAVIGADGHTVADSFSFTVAASVAANQ